MSEYLTAEEIHQISIKHASPPVAARLKATALHYIELTMELFTQACLGPDGKYDHQYVSAYENAQATLIEAGEIKREDCKYG